MATINPSQDYDIIHTLTYSSSGGTGPIRLHRGSPSSFTGTVYYRAGTSGAWTTLAVSGDSTTFPITSTTMQIAHDWNKSGNDHMTPDFMNGIMTGIAISQKAALSGIMGPNFMQYYALGCYNLTTLDVPDTSGLTSAGNGFMEFYASGCSKLTTLAIPDTSGLISAGSMMFFYANGCTSLTRLNLPKAGWFKTHNVNWNVPSGRLGLLHGSTTNSIDRADWQALTVSGKTLHTNYVRNSYDVRLRLNVATINPSQDYDIIHTLTYASSGGTDPIRLYRDSATAHADTVYYRAGTSGAWTPLAVSGTDTTFPITSTTMQIAHNWNKNTNNHMSPSFQNGTMTGISISQKAVLSGSMGSYLMTNYANGCSNLITLDVPDTSGLTSVNAFFMFAYAYNCTSLTTLDVPDTSGVTSAGNFFMAHYANGCSNLITLAVPDTSVLTSTGTSPIILYANNCTSLTELNLPKAGWFKTNNVNWSVPSGRLGLLHGDTTNPTDQADWQALTVPGKTLYTNYIRSTTDVWLDGVPPGTSNPTAPSNPGAFFPFF